MTRAMRSTAASISTYTDAECALKSRRCRALSTVVLFGHVHFLHPGRTALKIIGLRGSLMVSKALVAMTTSLLILAGAFGSAHAQPKPAGGPTTSPAGAAVYFVDIKDGQTVPTKFTVHFGLKGMGVAPAGSDKELSGHHHLLVDTEVPPLDQPIPSDFNHLHFGAGQTEAEVTLTPGEHTLQLLLGDKNHVPNTPPLMSEQIKVRVVDAAAAPSASAAGRHPSPAGAKVYFVYPTNRNYVTPNPVIRFGLIGMGVAPAGFEKA